MGQSTAPKTSLAGIQVSPPSCALTRTNVTRFVQFVNLLLNDVTYLLDEGLSKLTDINRLQKELESQPEAPPSANPREREQLLGTTERQATSYISLANDTVRLLAKFTLFVPDAFVYPEVVDRLARMLNFNQVVLTGDKCKNLKVKDPGKYRFNPKELLSMIVDIYLNLCSKQAFVIACARDGRSYRKEVFLKTTVILRKYNLKPPSDVDAFVKFVDAVEEAKSQDEEGEEVLGDIPDKFLGTLPPRAPG
jgi:ubiquitin conjugation factor E4 B